MKDNDPSTKPAGPVEIPVEERVAKLEKRIVDLERALMKAILHLTIHHHLADGRPAAPLADILQ